MDLGEVSSAPTTQQLRIRVVSRLQAQDQMWVETRASWRSEASVHLHNIINPDFTDKICRTCDGKSIVYAIGKRLVLVHFSPARSEEDQRSSRETLGGDSWGRPEVVGSAGVNDE